MMSFKIINKTEIIKEIHVCTITPETHLGDALEIYVVGNKVRFNAEIDGTGNTFEIPIKSLIEELKKRCKK